jgi:hypothetical protein
MQANHQLMVRDFVREKHHFGLGMEKYLQLKMGIVEIYFHHLQLLLKRLPPQKMEFRRS